MQIKLTLKSDLCAAAGKSYLNLVDTDICLDACGLPFIPARRLKGCLREAAQYIGMSTDNINKLFGEAGTLNGLLHIGNGTLIDSEEIRDALSMQQESFSPPEVADMFTRIIARTAVDDAGIAKQESLRTMRVLNHLHPVTGEENCFVFPVSCDTDDDKLLNALEDICKALRHMGLNRTRGLGVVRCEFDRGDVRASDNNTRCDAGANSIRICIELLDNVLMATASNEQCVGYIPGTALLGALANAYLKKRSADELFESLFLSGKVRFGNLYLHIEGMSGNAMPAPGFMGKIKSTNQELDGNLVTAFQTNGDTGERKALRDWMTDDSLNIARVKTEIVTHHSVAGEALYTQTSLCSGQMFSGEISSDDNDLLNEIAALLDTGVLYLGRSKTAQYARCKVLQPEYQSHTYDKVKYDINATIAFSLESDVILLDKQGVPTRSYQALLNALLPGGCNDGDILFGKGTALSFTTVHGYNAKRNLRNIPMAAFEKGSTIVVKLKREVELPIRMDIGSRLHEGFGRVRVWACDRLGEGAAVTKIESTQTQGNVLSENTEKLMAMIAKREDALKKGRELCNRYAGKCSAMTSSYIGRVLLMAEQATDFADMQNRVDGVADDDKKQATLRILQDKCFDDTKRDWRLCLITALRLLKYCRPEGGANA